MANPFAVAVPSPIEALMQGEAGYKGMRDIMSQRAQSDARAAAREALLSGNNPRNAIAHLIGAGDFQGANALATYQNNANGVFGTPIYGTDAQGNTVLGTLDKTGNFRRADMGGVTPTPGVKMLDTGTGYVPVNTRTGVAVQPPGGMQRPAAPMQPQAQPQPQQAAPIEGVPDGAVSLLRQNPNLARQFDEKYGSGASARVLNPQQAAPAQPQMPSGFIPKDNFAEARDKKFGTETGEKMAVAGKARASLQSAETNLDRLASEARRIINDPALTRITGIPGMFPSIPGGAAANLEAKLETLKSQIGFAVLQAMRDASTTGGALGQVSNYENQILQNNLAALSQAQSAPEFRKALMQIIEYTDGVKRRLREAYLTDYGGLGKGQAR